MQEAVLGIDVGTGSARAGLFTLDGAMLAQAASPLQRWTPQPNFVQQSTADIWNAVVKAAREALGAAGPVHVRGIGFDATCSMAVLDGDGAPVSIDPAQNPEQDVIMWMDHRALDQTARINAGDHEVLRYVGGQISPEMETPKLLWLRENMPAAWRKAALFLDLPDFLTWRATGAESRSLCSTVCKWTYVGHERRWDENYFRAIGLDDLADEGFRRIGADILPLGAAVGQGLSRRAAADFGLPQGTPVGVSAIDAHAGGIGVIGAKIGDEAPAEAMRRRVALIGGTSTCYMALSPEPRFVPGVWGPYQSAMVPGLWLNEAGQSATGALVDHVIVAHAAYPALLQAANERGQTIYQALNDRLDTLSAGLRFPAELTAGLHVMPDFHGNRSPRADPGLRGMVSGLSLSAGPDDLARLYLATIQAIAYGARHIIETLNAEGYAIDVVMAAGGGTKNPVFLREHADACRCAIVLSQEPEAVLLGAAMLGAVAGGAYPAIPAAMSAMSRAGHVVQPAQGEVAAFHAAKYRVFQRMHDDQKAYASIME